MLLENKEKIGGTDKTENTEKPQNVEKTSIFSRILTT